MVAWLYFDQCRVGGDMKIFTCVGFEGMWSAGTAAMVMADAWCGEFQEKEE